ncbi:MAG: glycosyltransferase family 2 protein [Clostridia bacterium]|nr:glycosyltransferase family 2 protein [Clostridia bacterium]
MKPEISVIMPVYNGEKNIRATVEAVLAQTFPDIEVIVLDDHSTDGTARLIEEYSERDERLRLIRLDENGGQGRARNIGIEAARGRYLSFIDADDLIAPDFLELLYNRAIETGAEVVKGRACKVPEGADPNDRSVQLTRNVNRIIAEAMRGGGRGFFCFASEHWSAIYSRDFITEHGIRYGSSRVHQDTTFLLMLAAYLTRIEIVDEAVYYYIQRSGSSIHSYDEKRFFAALDALEEQIEFINKSSLPFSFYFGHCKFSLLFALALHSHLRGSMTASASEAAAKRLFNVAMRYRYIDKLAPSHYALNAFVVSGGRDNIAIDGRIVGLEDNTVWQLDALDRLVEHINLEAQSGDRALAYLEGALSQMYTFAFVDAHAAAPERYDLLSERVRRSLMRLENKAALAKRCPQCHCLVEYGRDIFIHHRYLNENAAIEMPSALVEQVSRINAVLDEHDLPLYRSYANDRIDCAFKTIVGLRLDKESMAAPLIARLMAEAEKLKRRTAADAERRNAP